MPYARGYGNNPVIVFFLELLLIYCFIIIIAIVTSPYLNQKIIGAYVLHNFQNSIIYVIERNACSATS